MQIIVFWLRPLNSGRQKASNQQKHPNQQQGIQPASNMSLFSLGLLAAYFAGGMQYMMNQEGWDAADAFYFWCMTVSTVGYGDLAPTTPKTQAFVSVYAIVGLVLVWSIVSDYYGVVQGKLQDFQAKLLSTIGIELVDVHALPIDKHTPDQVNAKIKYWRRYLLALLSVHKSNCRATALSQRRILTG